MRVPSDGGAAARAGVPLPARGGARRGERGMRVPRTRGGAGRRRSAEDLPAAQLASRCSAS